MAQYTTETAKTTTASTMSEQVMKVFSELTELTRIALNSNLSGDELDELWTKKYEIQKKLFEYETLYNEMKQKKD